MTPGRRGARRFVAVFASMTLSSLVACGDTTAPTPEAQLLTAGLAAQTEGHTQSAITYFRQVLAQDPGNKYALYDLGLIYQQQGNTTTAAAQYRAALLSDPNYVPALFNLAIVRTKEAPYESIDLYRHVVALQPSYAEAHLNLGYVLRSVGQVAEGNAEIAKAVALKPSLSSPTPKPSS
jgi:tetratricopeptide (TPR) repeat protein